MKYVEQRKLAYSVRQWILVKVDSTASHYYHIHHEGVKSYPRGVTTNSDGGIESYESYYPVFETMQEVGMVLNLHGEVPSDTSTVRELTLNTTSGPLILLEHLCPECGDQILATLENFT